MPSNGAGAALILTTFLPVQPALESATMIVLASTYKEDLDIRMSFETRSRAADGELRIAQTVADRELT
jgi:hypothetical protein